MLEPLAVSVGRVASETMSLRPSDSGYPASLKALRNPPQALFMKGDETLLARRCVAVVGTRTAPQKTLDFARKLSSELAEAGFVVVSGGARGIDTAAHLGALEGGGKTIAVLPSSFGNPYPPENASLFERISENGLLVTEYAPGEALQRYMFVQRNRITASLSGAVVVIASGVDGGSMRQANEAAKQGKAVFCPDPSLGLEPSEGVLSLLESGKAKPFKTARELIAKIKA